MFDRRKKAVGKLLEEPSFQIESVAFLAGNPPADFGGGSGGVSGVIHSATPMFSFEKCKILFFLQDNFKQFDHFKQFDYYIAPFYVVKSTFPAVFRSTLYDSLFSLSLD